MSVTYGSGYIPGLLGWCTAQHGRHYAAEWGFGVYFETKVGTEMADFLQRLDAPGNHVFWAADAHGLCASLSLDADDADGGLSHLRWFIADERTRGQGVGQHLMRDAVAAARGDDAAGIYLWTFAGLDAARAVYEKFGFRLVTETKDTTWGIAMREQRFELHF